MFNLKSKPILIGTLAAFLMLPAAGFAADIGQVTLAVPNAQVVKSSGTVPAQKGLVLQGGDEVSTGTGQARFVLSDNSKFALPADSNFKVIEYAEKTPAAPAKAIYSFIKGAFRTVSGLIGKGEGDTYEVRTTIATMGIRGTDYAAVLKKSGDEKDGLYVMVFSGKVWVKNKARTIELAAGQIVYIKDDSTPPEFAGPDAKVYFENAGINPSVNFNLTLTPSSPFVDPNAGAPRPPVIRVPSTPVTPTPETPASPS